MTTEEYILPKQASKSAKNATRRSRLETIYDILSIIAGGVQRPTHVMYKANLSWSALREYLQMLENQGLITDGELGKSGYVLTEKGFTTLEKFKAIIENLQLVAEA